MKYLGQIVDNKDLVTKEYIDNNFLALTGGQVTGPVVFGDSISVDEATIGNLVVNGNASFTNNLQANTINGIAVGASPKFTDSDVSTLALVSGSTAGTSLSHGGKYTLTAGSKTVSFTMPSITNASLGQGRGTCSTAAATAAKAVTLSDYALTVGGVVTVKFTSGCTTLGSLNVNSKGAKYVSWNGTTATSSANIAVNIPANGEATFIYDGTNYVLLAMNAPFKGSGNSGSDTAIMGLVPTPSDVVGSQNHILFGAGEFQPIKLSTTALNGKLYLTISRQENSTTWTGLHDALEIPVATTSNAGLLSLTDKGNLQSKNAASGGTALSMVTTGEKYTWNNKAPLASPALTGTPTAPTAAADTNTTQIATTAFVTTAIANLPEPMIFKGSVGTGGTVTSLPTAAASNEGWTYKVITALSSPTAKVGDTVISNGSSWVVIPSGDEPSGTVTSIAAGAGLNTTSNDTAIDGGTITSSGTIYLTKTGVIEGSYGDSAAQTPGYGSTFKVPYITVDKYGRITGASEHTVKIPASDNTNTTYTLTNALASHKFTWTLTPSSGSATTTTAELVQGTGITLTDDTSNKKITIANAGVTGVKGNNESSYRTGQVNITKANIGLGNVDNTADANKNVLTATKFSSSRTIELTGDVTGSTSGDGSSGWSISTTVGDDSHFHTMAYSHKPIQSKTYANTSYYATSSGSWEAASWYFMSVKPDTWDKPWKIRIRVHSFCPGYTNVESYTDALITGRRDGLAYSNYTERLDTAHYYIPYYTLKKAGFDAGLGHAIGVSILYGTGYTTAAYYRTFEVDFYESENCTVTFFDTPIKWSSWTNGNTTNYNNLGSLDAVTRGYTESGDRNDANYQNRIYYTYKKPYATLYRYQILLSRADGTLLPVNSVDNAPSNISKTLTTEEFDPFGEIYYYSSSTTRTTSQNLDNYVLYRQILADLRYSFNITNESGKCLTGSHPIYIVATPQSNGMAKLASPALVQALPSTEDGKIYIYIGQAYPDTYPYRTELPLYHPIYWYKNGAICQYVGNPYTVNGHTVNSNVPANAVFTDTQSDWSATSGNAQILNKPTATQSATTGISIAAHGTGTVIGVQSTTTTASKVTVGSHSTDYGVKSAGSASTWTFEEKTIPNVTSAGTASSWTFEEKTIPNVTSAGSASTWAFTSKTVVTGVTFEMDATDTKKLKITTSIDTVYSKSSGSNGTAPTLGTPIKVQSKSGGSNGTAPTLGTPIKVQSKSGGANSTAPTLGSKVPTVSATNVDVPIKNASESTFVTGTTHSITDNGHTHSI